MPAWASKINTPLHDGCSPARPHPFQTVVYLLVEAFWKLRHQQSLRRAEASAKVDATAESLRLAKAGDDDEEMEKAQKEADKAVAAKALIFHEAFFIGVGEIGARAPYHPCPTCRHV